MPIFYPPVFVNPDSTATHATVVSSGLYVPNSHSGAIGSNTGLVADRIHISPFVPIHNFTCDQVVWTLTIGVGFFVKFVIYDANDDGTPNNLIHQSGQLDASIAGQMTYAFSYLFTGYSVYWVGLHVNDNITVKYSSSGHINVGSSIPPFAGNMHGLGKDVPFANNAPDPWGFALGDTNNTAPGMAFRVA